MPRPAPWSQLERDRLSELLGDQPFAVLVGCYRRWASAHGLPVRSKCSIECAAYRLGRTVIPTGQWLTSTAIGELLGRSRESVRAWAAQGWVRRSGDYLCRADLATLARERPWLFGGCDRSGLIQLLDSADLADQILESYPHQRGVSIPVVRLDTGRRYPSAVAAARACHVSPSTVRSSIKTGRPALEMRFAAAS